MKPHIILYVLVTAFLLIVSCDKNTSTGPEPDPDPDPDTNPNLVSENIGPDGGEITSSDGLLTLTLPAGALGNAETITITPLEADDLGSEFDEIEVEKAYELGPDGLEFDMPITATFVTEQNPIAGSDSIEFVNEFLLTSDNGQAVELDSLRTIVDLDEGTVTVQGQLEHFSPLAQSLIQLDTKATGRFGFSGLPDEVIAGSDIISALLVAQVNQVTESEEPFMVTRALIDQMLESPLVAVSPGEGNTEFPPENALSAELEYQCLIEGEGSLLLRGGFFDDNPRQGESEFSQSPSLQFGLFKSINCVEQMPTNFNLQVALDGGGSGSVSSDIAGINCPSDCEEEYEEGTKVTLTATSEAGSVFNGWSWSGDIDIGDNNADSESIQITMDQNLSVAATFGTKSSVGRIVLGLGVLPAVVTYVETILLQPFLNFVPPPGSQNKVDNSFMTQMAEDRLPLLVQGAEGFIVFDLISDELMLDFTNVVGNNTTGLRTPLGALAISRPNPGPDTPSVIASYGQDNAFYTFGFSLYPYDTQKNEYIKGPVSPYPSTVDAFPVGGESISDEVIIVREGGSGINFLRYNSVSDEYLFGPSNESLVSARYGFEQPVTAYGEFVDGPLLVVNIKGDLYFEPRNRLIYSPSVLIGNLGERIIRIRCELPVCVATDFEGSAVRIITWDGETAPSIVGNPVSVGSGPVDPDLYTLPDGRILIAVTGFDDNTISLLEVDSGGNILSNTLYEAPQGCENPGHVIIEDNPDDAANPLVIGSCYESANYFVNDLINSGGLFTVIGGM